MPHRLPASYYELACSGKALLVPLGGRTTLRTPSGVTTRSGLLYDSMMANHFLPLALSKCAYIASPDTPCCRVRNWAHSLARVPGFCYLKLFRWDWIVPAISTLSPYPDTADVARLSHFFYEAAAL